MSNAEREWCAIRGPATALTHVAIPLGVLSGAGAVEARDPSRTRSSSAPPMACRSVKR